MTPDTIKQGNELINKFMGYEVAPWEGMPGVWKAKFCQPDKGGTDVVYGKDKADVHQKMETQLQYHRDWNWLMKAIDKIESIELIRPGGDDINTFYVWISDKDCSIEWDTHNASGTEIDINGHDMESKIYMVWTCVVRFVEWFNKNKPNN